MAEMTPRERVLAAINHQEPDRVPLEIGVDIINPVPVSAMGDTTALKARFGDRVTFWDAIDTQHVLPHGTVEEVEAEVQHRIREFGAYPLAA